jgi:LAO/AO transport system kinase
MPPSDPDQLATGVEADEPGAIARAITVIESGGEAADRLTARLHHSGGHGYTLGVTGAPGSGKSTLTGRLLERMQAEGQSVGVLAIDPTSPFTGGAILGDRIRMQTSGVDGSVFIRSMATRGHLGGLALSTPQAARVLDAAGRDWIVIETVGVGQVEVDVVRASDTTVVVLNPGWGDGVQAAKAGLMEIADVFVVNKADRAGTAETVREVESTLDLASGSVAWRPPVVTTVATEGVGIVELWDAIAAHRAAIGASGELAARRRRRIADEVRRTVAARLDAQAAALCRGAAFDALIDRVAARTLDPGTAAATVVAGGGTLTSFLSPSGS